MTRRTLLQLLFLTCFLTGAIAEESPTTIAIFPFENLADENHSWISIGIADSLISKFSGVKNIIVVERELLRPLLNIDTDQELAQIVGADVMLVGSYAIVDDVISIRARAVNVETGVIQGTNSMRIRGPVEELLNLEMQLADQFCKSAPLKVEMGQIRSFSTSNYDSHRLFNLGKLSFEGGAFDESIEFFMEAQRRDEGHFFSEAHSWEGLARLKMAEEEERQKEREAIQLEHLRKFEEDASSASHAIIDLAVALQAHGRYEDAIHHYDEFLRWYSKQYHPFLFSTEPIFENVNTPLVGNYYEHGKRSFDMCRGPVCRWYALKPWVVDDTNIYYIKKGKRESYKEDEKTFSTHRGQLICASVLDGVPKWTLDLGALEFSTFQVGKDHLMVATRQEVIWLDKITGRVSSRVKLPLEFRRKEIVKKLPQLFSWENKEISILVVFMNKQKTRVLGFDMKSKEMIWQSDIHDPSQRTSVVTFQDELFILGQEGLQRIDIHSGAQKRVAVSPQTDGLVVEAWPGKDHLLLRKSSDPRKGQGDQFFRYFPMKDTVEGCDENIFFTYIYNQCFDGYDQCSTPVMNIKTKLYELMPLQWILPLTASPGMDRWDKVPSDKYANDTVHQPWVVLDDDKLWVWTRDRQVKRLESQTGSLEWREHIPLSGGSISSVDSTIFVHRTGENREHQIYAYHSSTDRFHRRNIEALMGKAKCFEALAKSEEVEVCLEKVLKQQPTHTLAHFRLAKHMEAKGDLISSSRHHDAVLRFGSHLGDEVGSARAWLEDHAGLMGRSPVAAILALEITSEHMVVQEPETLKIFDLSGNLQRQFHSMAEWMNDDECLYGYEASSSQLTIENILSGENKSMTLGTLPVRFHTGRVMPGYSKYKNSYQRHFLISGKTIFFMSQNGELVAKSLIDGKRQWERKLPKGAGVSVNRDKRQLMTFALQGVTPDLSQVSLNSLDGETGQLVFSRSIEIKHKVDHLYLAWGRNEVFLFSVYDRRRCDVTILNGMNGEDMGTIKSVGFEMLQENNGHTFLSGVADTTHDFCILIRDGLREKDYDREKRTFMTSSVLINSRSGKAHLLGPTGGYGSDLTMTPVSGSNEESVNFSPLSLETPRMFRSNGQELAFWGQNHIYLFDQLKFVHLLEMGRKSSRTPKAQVQSRVVKNRVSADAKEKKVTQDRGWLDGLWDAVFD